MALVKGPNGMVFDWPEPLVAALVRSDTHERADKEKSAPRSKSDAEVKPAAKRAAPAKSKK